MTDGTFRRLIRDEEMRREEYLDRQLELGWEEDPADAALESPDRLSADPILAEAQGAAPARASRPAHESGGRKAARRPSWRLVSAAASAARHTGSRS